MRSTKEFTADKLKHYTQETGMNHLKKAIVMATLFASSTMVNIAMSDPFINKSGLKLPLNAPHMHTMIKQRVMRSECKPYLYNHNLGLKINKNLSDQDAKIIVKATLLQDNRPTYRIGPITTLRQSHGPTHYAIVILNGQKKMVSTVIFNSATGTFHPAMDKKMPEK